HCEPVHREQGSLTMGASAIIMMIIAMVTVWGGLAGAILHLRNHPDEERPESTSPRKPPDPGRPAGGGPERAITPSPRRPDALASGRLGHSSQFAATALSRCARDRSRCARDRSCRLTGRVTEAADGDPEAADGGARDR